MRVQNYQTISASFSGCRWFRGNTVREGIGAVLGSTAWCFAEGYEGKQSTSTQVFRRYMGAEVDYF